MKAYLQAALEKELRIAPFVELFKTTTLRKSLPNQYIFADCLLIVSYL